MPVGMAVHDRGVIVAPRLLERQRLAEPAQRLRPLAKPTRIRAAGSLGGGVDELGTDVRCDAQIIRVDATREIVPPRQERVDPSADRVRVAPRATSRRTRRQAVPEGFHRCLVPLGLRVVLVADDAADDVATSDRP